MRCASSANAPPTPPICSSVLTGSTPFFSPSQMRVKANWSKGNAPSRPSVSLSNRVTVASSNGCPANSAGLVIASLSSSSLIAGTITPCLPIT